MLKHLQSLDKPILVGLTGAGCMGQGIARQIASTPGMALAWVADQDLSAAEKSARLGSCSKSGTDTLRLLEQHPVDAFVEATNSIGPAFEYCSAAARSGAHVILMNAEVDLAFGPELHQLAKDTGKVVTSDAGDQHGVLATMIEEIEMWGFEIVQAGNIKGYLRREATAAELVEEAAKRNLSPIQCCAYTDGTKLNIEMAVLANALGYLPTQVGMTGPRAARVEEALTLFDFSQAQKAPSVDYLLGAEPGGGVYVIGRCHDPAQVSYLSYYKLGDGPEYLFFRPYHLCHLETPRAIARAVLYGEAVLSPAASKLTDVYAHAKRHLPAGHEIRHGIGGDDFYGLIASCEEASAKGWVPIAELDLPSSTYRLKHGQEPTSPLLRTSLEP